MNKKNDKCPDGYWITKSDVGFSANLALIFSTYQAKSNIWIYGIPTQVWSGSSGIYCKLYQITLN